MNHVGNILLLLFQPTRPSRRRCKIIITQKNTCLTSSSSTNITNLSTNPSIGGEGRVCTIAKWWDLELILCFARIQSNSIAFEGSCQSMVYRSVRVYHYYYKTFKITLISLQLELVVSLWYSEATPPSQSLFLFFVIFSSIKNCGSVMGLLICFHYPCKPIKYLMYVLCNKHYKYFLRKLLSINYN